MQVRGDAHPGDGRLCPGGCGLSPSAGVPQHILLLLTDGDPLGVDTFATHELPLESAPHAYEVLQQQRDGAVEILLKP